MFNRIISRIRETDRGRDSPPTSPSRTAPDAEDGEELETAEGFLCPTCMVGFPSPEDLHTHYENSHADGSGSPPGHLCPMCRMKMKSMQELQDHYAHHHVTSTRNGDLETLKQEVAELHTTLREEKWYSEDLKREVERLHATVGSKDNGDKFELEDIYKQQIKTLEENKALLSSEVVLLRNQLSEAVETNVMLKQEKDRLEQKAAHMASDVVSLKANVDEKAGFVAATELQCKELQDQVLIIEAQLQQRPEADDVAVLRQELVQVQTLMDKMTQEREQEKEALASNFKDLQEKYDQLRSEKDRLMEELALAPKQEELDSLKVVLSENSSGTKEVQTLLQQKIQDNIELQETLSKIENELKEAVSAFLVEKTTCEELTTKLQLKEKAAEEVNIRLSEQTRKCEQQEALIIQHAQLLKTSEADLNTTQISLNQLQDDLQQELLSKEQQLNAVQLELEKTANSLQEKESHIDSLSRQLDTMQSQLQQQITECDDLKTQLWEKQNQIDEETRQKESRDAKVQELENTLVRYKDTTERLNAERTDLYAKIEAGDGANTAIQQLKEETVSLQEKLAEQQTQAERQTEESAKKLENLHKLLQETKSHLQSANDKCGKLETSMKDLSAKLRESQGRVVKLEADLKMKSELLHASEAAKANQKSELESQLRSAANTLDDHTKQLEKLKGTIQKNKSETANQQEIIQHLEANLTQEKEKSRNYQARCVALEANVVERTEEISALSDQNKEIKVYLHEANAKLASLEEELKKIEKSSRDQIRSFEETKNKLQQQVHRLESERTGLLNDKNVFEKQYRELDENLSKRIALLQESSDTTQAEKRSLEVQLDELEHAKQMEHAEMQEQIVLARSLCDQQKSEVAMKDKEIIELNLKVKELEEQKHELQENINASENKSREQTTELQKQVEEIQKFKADLQAKEKAVELLQQQLQTARSELEQHEVTSRTNKDDLSQLRKAHEEVISKLRGVEKKLRESQAEFAELQKFNEGVVKELDESRQNEQALTKSLEDLNQVKSVLGQQMLKLDTELKRTIDKQQALTVLKASLETELFTKQQMASELEEKCTDAENRLLDFQKSVAEERSDNEQVIMGLQAARELLINQKVEIQNQLDSVGEQLASELKGHQLTKETLGSQLEVFKEKSRTSKEELTNLQSVLQALRLEKEQKEARYEMQISALNENLTTLRGDFISEQNKAQDLEKRVDDLSGDKLELEAKLENALDERRALLERCLVSEGECEQLRTSSTELRHKLDDALAAIHELGRENQTLQIESAKLTSRKWAEDAEVTNCTLCQKLFSVTIRKHHCRNCGNIFCSECSTRTAAVAASKKRVRVCDLCFAELSK